MLDHSASARIAASNTALEDIRPQNENGLPEGKPLGCSAAWDGWEFPVASGNNKTSINSVV